MAWKCPMCGEINNDDSLIKCLCDHEVNDIDVKRYKVIVPEDHSRQKRFLNKPWLPYIVYFSLMFLLYIMAFEIEQNSESYRSFFIYSQPVIALLVLCFIFIAWVIVYSNKGNPSIVFKKLSKLPLLLIISHIPFILIDKPYSSHGGWWILYALIVICFPLSFILYGIGAVYSRKVKSHIIKNGT